MTRLLSCFLGPGALASALTGAAGSGGQVPPAAAGVPSEAVLVHADGSCPDGARVTRHLLTLLPGAPGGGGSAPREDAPRVHVKDRGRSYLVEVAGRSRVYEDAARDCGRRAEAAALFAALVLDPLARGKVPLREEATTETPEARAAASAPSSPPPGREEATSASKEIAAVTTQDARTEARAREEASRPVPPAAALEESPTAASTTTALPREGAGGSLPRTWLDLAGLGAVVVGGDGAAQAGGSVRAGRGLGVWALALGARVLAPRELTREGVALRQSRVTAEVEILRRGLAGALTWEASIGASLARVDARATNLAQVTEDHGWEAALRGAAGLQLGRARRVAPFASLGFDLVPSPVRIYALPRGELAGAPWLWLTLTVGARIVLGDHT